MKIPSEIDFGTRLIVKRAILYAYHVSPKFPTGISITIAIHSHSGHFVDFGEILQNFIGCEFVYVFAKVRHGYVRYYLLSLCCSERVSVANSERWKFSWMLSFDVNFGHGLVCEVVKKILGHKICG
jgi:hypothetical protein